MLQLELSLEETHWLRYNVLRAISHLPQDDTELRVIYESVLEKTALQASNRVRRCISRQAYNATSDRSPSGRLYHDDKPQIRQTWR